MAWITQNDLIYAADENLLIDLTSDEISPTEINTAVLNALMARSVSIIKGRLRRRYPDEVAAETASGDITEIAVCLTLRQLYNRRDHYPMPKGLADRISEAMTYLNSIASGEYDVAEWGDYSDDEISIASHEFPKVSDDFNEWLDDRTEFTL